MSQDACGSAAPRRKEHDEGRLVCHGFRTGSQRWLPRCCHRHSLKWSRQFVSRVIAAHANSRLTMQAALETDAWTSIGGRRVASAANAAAQAEQAQAEYESDDDDDGMVRMAIYVGTECQLGNAWACPWQTCRVHRAACHNVHVHWSLTHISQAVNAARLGMRQVTQA